MGTRLWYTRGLRSDPGEVAEWSNAPDSKSGLRFHRNVGSNPTLSASDLMFADVADAAAHHRGMIST